MKINKILCGLSAILCGVNALPLFEVANQYDRHGNKCPLLPHYNVSCPTLCVKDQKSCPSALSPTCPPGLSFCGDGSCHESCENIANVCQCGDDTVQYFPCAAGQLVNITHFDPQNQVTQIQNTCAAAANITASDIGVWGVFNTSSIWLSCPVIDPAFTYKEPMWISVWSLMSAEAAILILWAIYKYLREMKFRNAMAARMKSEKMAANNQEDEVDETDFKKEIMKVDEKKPASAASTSDADSLKESERLKFRGYKNDFFGYIAFGSVVITTLLFFVFLGVLVGDYYGTVTGVALQVFLSSDLSSKIFAAVWHISAAWFCIVMLTRKTIRNYFRIESYPHKCPYVQVERKQEELIFLDDGSKWLAKLRSIEQRIYKHFGLDILVTTCTVRTKNSLRYFEYQCMRYIYNSEKSRFEPYEYDLGSTNKKLQSWSSGISSQEAENRLSMLGPNIIQVYVPSIPMAIIQEFSSFLYLYQMMCMWVWYYFQYYKMGLVQTCIILFSAFIRIFLRLRADHRIKDMAEHVTDVTVLRDGQWIDTSSANLVPGDIFEVKENTLVPTDAVILSGTVVVNESSLTGEAMPIRKFAIPNDDNIYEMNGSGKVNTLFAGTIVSQVTPAINTTEEKNRVFALTLRTGIATEKGMLIHKILFPAPVSFIFNEHIKVAISILLVWGLVAFCLSLYLMGRGNITSWFYGVFVMSEIFSPLLPAAFTINQSVCAARLRTKKILCIDLPRINLSGKVRIFCFDKTGTLTREGLEFYGGVPSPVGKAAAFGDRQEDPLTMEPLLAMGIATCHAVTQVKDQFIGNPVDIESFNSMKWKLLPPAKPEYLDTLVAPSTSPEKEGKQVHVVRRFEFVHARASQSVAVLDPETNQVHVFLKGSFERIKHLSNADSLPADYDQEAAKHAQVGCYVLALAHRTLGTLDVDVTMEQIKSMTRDELEQGCDFTGFVLFRNMLKHDTTDAIAELKNGDTRVVMITGDTALTGIYIARQCGMIESHQRVLLGDLVSGSVVWHDVDSGEQVDVDEVIQADTHEEHEKRVELAITGRAFEALISQGKMRKYLLMTRVFARMTPNDKVMCIQLHMEKGITAMCGDGGNDCGALRAAHVGLALSEAEASIVSPFSTSNRSIMQCVELLRQGRSAIATSFANYKFLILYGECMAFWELCMFYFTVISPQPVWITIDGFITTTMTLAITQALPAKKLSPCRPTAKPLGAYTLASLLGVIFINFWFLVCSIVWLFQQDWFICNQFDSSAIDSAKWWLLGDNYEAEVMSIVILFQFFNNGAVVNFGSQFRQSWWRNYVLVFVWCAFFISTSYITLANPNPYGCIFRINCGSPEALVSLGYPEPTWYIDDYNFPLKHNVLPVWFRWQLWGYVLANCACTIIWERICILWIARDWAVKRKATHPSKNRVIFKL
ncbi:hypothetical protein G6F70_001036 [Rhizopus microsporus]|uniref:Uncharacterized protein n=2 Tax=Rhizopus TaxID=4842 RepID=A0A367K6E6_RHIAZ|nr:hypothetical protein G6F71_006623 [Rhizopus microsporus]RCH97726.1 hypothetical protein CU097_014628 [Rhizopus azygosporus]KAG1203800.1 hypothetical protein G6F70_001036 [Rhizopus microsporus]KAG1209196.1 hypothetical protein G6F69_006558 [Rhizopus microsporus]KAG1230549.1 hypothetical protein G6F67_006378 [Rhizopus microsporus]